MPVGALKVLRVDVARRSHRVEEVRLGGDVLGMVDYGVKLHLEELRSYGEDPFSPRNAVVAGCGPFSGSRLFGSHRMVMVFRSPETLGLHVSTMGGACFQFVRSGLRGVVFEGWSDEPLLVVIRGGSGVEVEFHEVGWDRLWEVWRGYGGYRGTAALAWYMYRELGLDPRQMRVAVTGPAAARTIIGGVFSYMVEGRGLSPVVDSASRAGPGSVLLRAHGVAGFAFGGSSAEALRELADLGRVADEAARRVLGRGYAEAVRETTVKYRYDPRLGTGGTFGVNYVHYRDMLPFFGYDTVYLSKPERMRIAGMVVERLWRPVQREVFESGSKPWKTCGEPCLAVCKKIWRGVKLDYEPSNALGGLIGVVEAEHMAELVRLVDELGLDAIEAGHFVAWLFELVHRGLLSPEEAGLSGRPFFDPITYTPAQSEANRRLAAEALEGLVEHRTEVLRLVAEEGLRSAAMRLNEAHPSRTRMYGMGYHDFLVYGAYGDKGYMTPNLYWAPGLVAPIPLPGRYWSVYSASIPRDPREFAETIIERMVNEYLVDNAGMCRFHRRWAEKIMAELYRAVLGRGVDLRGHARRVLGMIAEYRARAGAEPRSWESRKTIDMAASLAAELGDAEFAGKLLENPEEYWRGLRDTIWGWLLGGEEAKRR